MAAPKGNQFWLKRGKHGRDSLVNDPEKLWEDACGYFDWAMKNPIFKVEKLHAFQGDVIRTVVDAPVTFTIHGLVTYLGIGLSTWKDLRSNTHGNVSEEMSAVTAKIEAIIYRQKFEGAAAGVLNSLIIARDLGLKEQVSQDNTSSDGSMTPQIDASKLSDSTLREILAARSKTPE